MRAVPVLERTATELGQLVQRKCFAEMTCSKRCLKLLDVIRGEGASRKDGADAGLDGGSIGPAGFGITNERNELSGERIHRQACHRLRADGGVDGADQ